MTWQVTYAWPCGQEEKGQGEEAATEGEGGGGVCVGVPGQGGYLKQALHQR